MDQSLRRATQLANVLTTSIGFVLSIAGLVVLIFRSASSGDGLYILTSSIYGGSLVISYAVFTLYHIYKFNERMGRFFKILDHSTIYLLIAGTYTPLTLVLLRGNWGWTLFSVAWAMAVLGVIGKILFIDKVKWLGPLLYLIMGWMCVLIAKPAIALIPLPGLQLLLAGGLFYSFGLIFYLWKRLPLHHAIWHLFVLVGSICHFFAVYAYIIPPA
jgi:hemolysin III